MTVALLVRDSALARRLAVAVAERWDLRVIVAESGRSARRRKLRRELGRGLPWRFPLNVLDLAALWLFERAGAREVASGGGAVWPNGPTVVHVDDANDPQAVSVLRHAEPDIVVVLGTAVLTGGALRVARRYLLNVHGGIVPEYRNVHSDFWALMNDDLDNVGVSIIHLDEGIDTGAVALQKRLRVERGESLFSVRFRNGRLAIEAALEALELAETGELPAIPQDADKRGFYRTPGFSALLSFYRKTRKGVS